VIDLKNRVLLHHAEQDEYSQRRVKIERVASPHNDSNANGTESGKLNRIVNGWTVLSNCEARIMYMKITDRMKAQMNSVNVFSSSRARPETLVVYAIGKIHLRDRASQRFDTIGKRVARRN
jgi:hypothetical protein